MTDVMTSTTGSLTGAPVQATNTQHAPTAQPAPTPNPTAALVLRRIGLHQIRTGLTWAAVGVLVTVITFNLTHGGTTIVAFGPVIFGVRMVFRGLKTLARSTKTH